MIVPKQVQHAVHHQVRPVRGLRFALLQGLREVIKKELSVRKTEALVKDLELGRKYVERNGEIHTVASGAGSSRSTSQSKANRSSTLGDLEDSLRHIFATQVRVKLKSDDAGTIEVEFYSMEELERLLEVMLTMQSPDQQ